MNELLSPSQASPELDAMGSLMDADMGAYYTCRVPRSRCSWLGLRITGRPWQFRLPCLVGHFKLNRDHAATALVDGLSGTESNICKAVFDSGLPMPLRGTETHTSLPGPLRARVP